MHVPSARLGSSEASSGGLGGGRASARRSKLEERSERQQTSDETSDLFDRGPVREVLEDGVVGEDLGHGLVLAQALLEALDLELLIPQQQGDDEAALAG